MERRQQLRGIAALVLIVLGSVGLVLASAGWWLERNFLDTGRFTGTADKLLDQRAVQDELTNVLVKRLSAAAGTDLQVAEPFLAGVVRNVVESSPFRAVFDTALSRAHRILVDRDTGKIVLDLTAAYDQVKGPLEQVAPKLAKELPDRRELNVLLLHRSQLTTVWDVIDRVKRTVEIITIAAVLLVAGGIALALDRWRTLARAAWIVAGGLVVLWLALVLARVVVQAQISDPGASDAAGAAFRVITRPLVVQSVVLAAIAALVALFARFTQRHGLAAWRPTVAQWWAWLRGALPAPAEGTAGAGTGATVGATAAVSLARVRLPQPRVDTRAVHVWRAVALLAIGLFAVFDPAGVTTVFVVIVGIVVLYLAATEGIAAAGSQSLEHN